MRYLLSCLFCLLAGSALAQAPVFTTVTAGSITTTNTFQSALTAGSADAPRRGCAIQNLGSNNMWVFFGASGATTPTSIKLTPASVVRCDAGPVVLQDRIWITGTTLEQFVVMSQ